MDSLVKSLYNRLNKQQKTDLLLIMDNAIDEMHNNDIFSKLPPELTIDLHDPDPEVRIDSKTAIARNVGKEFITFTLPLTLDDGTVSFTNRVIYNPRFVNSIFVGIQGKLEDLMMSGVYKNNRNRIMDYHIVIEAKGHDVSAFLDRIKILDGLYDHFNLIPDVRGAATSSEANLEEKNNIKSPVSTEIWKRAEEKVKMNQIAELETEQQKKKRITQFIGIVHICLGFVIYFVQNNLVDFLGLVSIAAGIVLIVRIHMHNKQEILKAQRQLDSRLFDRYVKEWKESILKQINTPTAYKEPAAEEKKTTVSPTSTVCVKTAEEEKKTNIPSAAPTASEKPVEVEKKNASPAPTSIGKPAAEGKKTNDSTDSTDPQEPAENDNKMFKVLSQYNYGDQYYTVYENSITGWLDFVKIIDANGYHVGFIELKDGSGDIGMKAADTGVTLKDFINRYDEVTEYCDTMIVYLDATCITVKDSEYRIILYTRDPNLDLNDMVSHKKEEKSKNTTIEDQSHSDTESGDTVHEEETVPSDEASNPDSGSKSLFELMREEESKNPPTDADYRKTVQAGEFVPVDKSAKDYVDRSLTTDEIDKILAKQIEALAKSMGIPVPVDDYK